MEWKGRRQSENVEDARGQKVVVGGAAIALITRFVARLWGWKGIMVLAGMGLIGGMFGLFDPLAMLTGQPQVREVEYEPTPEEQELMGFVRVVLADTEDIWTREFARIGEQYVPPTLVVIHSANSASWVRRFCSGSLQAELKLLFSACTGMPQARER